MESKRDIFQAIADPTKRAIIVLLTAGSMMPTAIVEHFDNNRQAVSKHLKVLTECNLIKPHQRARKIYYHLENRQYEKNRSINQFRKIWEKKFNRLDELLLIFNSKTNEAGN